MTGAAPENWMASRHEPGIDQSLTVKWGQLNRTLLARGGQIRPETANPFFGFGRGENETDSQSLVFLPPCRSSPTQVVALACDYSQTARLRHSS